MLTYQEAELVAADAMSSAAPDLWSAGTGNYLARIVLEAVGYADLLAEVERLRYVESNLASARSAGRSYRRQRDTARAEIERLRALSSLWQPVVSADGFEAAVNVMAQAYHKTECAYGVELAELRKTVRLAVDDLLLGRSEVGVIADLRAALPVSHVES